jgi:hypothetical protein
VLENHTVDRTDATNATGYSQPQQLRRNHSGSRLDLFRKKRTQTPRADIVERTRSQDIGIHMLNPPGAPGGGSAFRISSTYHDRNKAQAVARNRPERRNPGMLWFGKSRSTEPERISKCSTPQTYRKSPWGPTVGHIGDRARLRIVAGRPHAVVPGESRADVAGVDLEPAPKTVRGWFRGRREPAESPLQPGLAAPQAP